MRTLKNWQIGAAAALGLGALSGGGMLAPAAKAQDGVTWLRSIEEGQSAARQVGKPVFLVFR